jgi:hypothetical protein
VYFAYGRRQDLLSAVQAGLGHAFSTFSEAEPNFLLPSGLRIIVAVRHRNRELVIYSTFVGEPCAPSQLSWTDSRYLGNNGQDEWEEHGMKQQITVKEQNMTEFNNENLFASHGNPIRDPGSEDRRSYQTAPLVAYSAEHRQVAEEFCNKIARLGARTKRYKGSYSIFGMWSQETAAKVVICEDGKGKANGGLHLRPGVYALVRANGATGERNRATLAANGLLTVLSGNGTIGVAPKHEERFHYMRVDDTNQDQCLELLRACACS